ncbi:Glutamine-dependent NAD(+) synthetase [Apodemus speciosus]|uniref:Glutamine-dependent NAD(+) synthetase n=1 Tax=Apodemus speciosus TaxID=105296 RepID=A0ABQ0FRR4_APOSI
MVLRLERMQTWDERLMENLKGPTPIWKQLLPKDP